MNALVCASSFDDFIACGSQRNLGVLEVMHEGINQVKQSKSIFLSTIMNYLKWRMMDNRSMFSRFTKIVLVQNLQGYLNCGVITKVFRSLLRSQETKFTAIRVAKGLKTLPFNHLLGSLITYEMMSGEDLSRKRKKGIVVKVSMESQKKLEGGNGFTKKFKCFLNKNSNRRKI